MAPRMVIGIEYVKSMSVLKSYVSYSNAKHVVSHVHCCKYTTAYSLLGIRERFAILNTFFPANGKSIIFYFQFYYHNLPFTFATVTCFPVPCKSTLQCVENSNSIFTNVTESKKWPSSWSFGIFCSFSFFCCHSK